MSRQTNRLTGKDHFNMQCFVRDNYAKLGLHDKEFAEVASKELGFTVTWGNVQGAREVFEIPSTRAVNMASNDDLASLRKRIEVLEQRIEVYLTGCCKEGPKHGN